MSVIIQSSFSQSGLRASRWTRCCDITISEVQGVAIAVHKIFRTLSTVPNVKFGILHAGNFCLVAHPTEEPRIVLMKPEIDADSLPPSSALYKITNHKLVSARSRRDFLDKPMVSLHAFSLGTLLMELLFPTTIDSFQAMKDHVSHAAICWDYLGVPKESKLSYIPSLLAIVDCPVTPAEVIESWQRCKTRIRP